MRYPRGKSWNWYKRAIKRKDVAGPIWLQIRLAKHAMIRELSSTIFGSGKSEKEFTGLKFLG